MAKQRSAAATQRRAFRYPEPGDIYSSYLNQGENCKVISVANGQVTYRWLRDDAFVDIQSMPAKVFLRYFDLRMYPVQ